MINQKQIRELFTYNQHTGILKRRSTKKEVGSINTTGYLQVSANGKSYLSHRLIWCGVHGYFPEHVVDHINRNKLDNRLCNLREASRQCNSRNRKTNCNNASGIKGVRCLETNTKWRAHITSNGKKKHIGQYKNFDEAVIARYKAEEELNWNSCDQESPACKYLRENGLILDRVNEPYI